MRLSKQEIQAAENYSTEIFSKRLPHQANSTIVARNTTNKSSNGYNQMRDFSSVSHLQMSQVKRQRSDLNTITLQSSSGTKSSFEQVIEENSDKFKPSRKQRQLAVSNAYDVAKKILPDPYEKKNTFLQNRNTTFR